MDQQHHPDPACAVADGPDVDGIARRVVDRMHDAELAMMRHLEAVDLEATRRCELLTAQAELDAELIRLHARREAHALVAAARERTGAPAVSTFDAPRLDALTQTLSRFADVLEELRPTAPALTTLLGTAPGARA